MPRCSVGRAPTGCSTCACTTRVTSPPTVTAASTTRRTAAVPAWSWRPGPLFDAVEAAAPPRPLLLLSPSGRRFDQSVARELAASDGFSLLCGRYEGVDQRVADHLCDGELSVGDYVLAGGEAAALVVIDAVARLVPGVMGNADVRRRRVVRRRPARVPAVHPARRVPGMGGARSAAERRPRPARSLAAGPGAATHARPAARPPRPGVRSPRRRKICCTSSPTARSLISMGSPTPELAL